MTKDTFISLKAWCNQQFPRSTQQSVYMKFCWKELSWKRWFSFQNLQSSNWDILYNGSSSLLWTCNYVWKLLQQMKKKKKPEQIQHCQDSNAFKMFSFFNSFSFFFLAVLGHRNCAQAFSSCSEWGLLFLWCMGFSLWWLLLLQSTGSRHTGFSSCRAWAQ